MRQLSPSQIDNYLRYDRAWDCVGAYKIESQGIGLFASIEGCDHTAIMGLPLIHLVSLLTEFGLIIP
jgi:septum formation protein